MDQLPDCEDEVKLELFTLNEHEFIGRVKLNPVILDDSSKANAVQTVIFLDKSGSMGGAVTRVANDIIPKALTKLGYKRTDCVHLIMFESRIYLETVTVERLKSLFVSAAGGTNMAPAVKKFQMLSQNLDEKKPIRLLIISDGQVSDITETEKAASALIDFLRTKNFSINSQAVRLFTSNCQPDTRAICSLLQLNNMTLTNLADISADEANDVIAEKIKQLFEDDELSNVQNLTTEVKVIFKHPWDSTPVSSLSLVPGENLFWINGHEAMNMHIEGKPVEVELQQQLTIDSFQELMKDKMLYIVDHMKVLKVVGTDKAHKTINTMLKYFQEKENGLLLDAILDEHAITESPQSKKLSALLTRIANDESVAGLDLAEKAEYLREEIVIEEMSPETIEKPTSEEIREDAHNKLSDEVTENNSTLDEEFNENRQDGGNLEENVQLSTENLKRYFPLFLAVLLALLSFYLMP